MIGRVERRSRTAERLVLALGILLILTPISATLLGLDVTGRFFGARDFFSQSNIGEVLRPSKIVKRKGEDDLAYESANQGDPIHTGDTVMTGKESFTRITLTDGTALELGPESLIKIDPVRTFTFAGIEKKLRVTVVSGKVKVLSSPNSASVVLVNSAGEILEEIAPPAPDEVIPAATGGPAAKPDALASENTPAVFRPTFVNPLFARAEIPEKTPKESPVPAQAEFVPELTSPADGFDAGALPRIGGHRDLVLAWKRNSACREYELEVFRTKTGEKTADAPSEKPLLRKRLPLHFSGFRIPRPGRYRWRVGCVQDQNMIGFSESREFRDSGK